MNSWVLNCKSANLFNYHVPVQMQIIPRLNWMHYKCIKNVFMQYVCVCVSCVVKNTMEVNG